MNAPHNLGLATAEIERIAAELRDMCGDDERLYLDMLTGETSVEEIVRALLCCVEDEEGRKEALKLQIAERKARADMCDRRMEKAREGILKVMRSASLDKLPLPEATISVRAVAAKLVVNDPDAVPADYLAMKPAPNMALIREGLDPDGPLPNWLRVEPAGETISIRRK